MAPPRTVQFDTGSRIDADRTLMRIVSLLPAATEIVYALGLADALVGVTFECDEPPTARRDKRIVVAGRDTSTMTPGAIDAYVRAQAAAGEDLYHLHHDALAEIEPDVILTQDLCQVCALPSESVSDALAYLGTSADVVALDPHSLEDVLDTIDLVGAHTGASERAAVLVAALRTRLAAISSAVAGAPSPRVAVVEWIDPPFAAGHWVPDLVAAAGGIAIAARPGARSVPTTWDDIRAADPDVVVVAPCGYHLDGASSQGAVVADAVPGPAIWAIDADGLVVRPGPRLVDGVEALASVLHPGAVPARPDAVRLVRA